MKKQTLALIMVLSFFIIEFLGIKPVFAFNINLPPGFQLPPTITVYNILGSPFKITKKATWGYFTPPGQRGGYQTKYDCYIELTPNSVHANMQRVEYIGCQVAYTDNSIKFYQMFPSGGFTELTDINQALYSPSLIVTQPSMVGQYHLFTQYRDFDLQRPATFYQSITNLPMSFGVSQITFMAGYGFLTPDDINLINQYHQVRNSPELQNQPGITLLDENIMKWSLAQGNMFKYTSYYSVLNITNPYTNNWYLP